MSGDTTSSLIESLKLGKGFAHEVSGIDVIETHISWVVLTGPFAYKIKKPVNLGFVDFLTLSRREFCCHEELRLNRRLAPQLYRGVVEICGTAEDPIVAGTGEPIEFAIQMEQFSQENLLSRCLSEGRLTTHHIDSLADEIADFHARVAIAESKGEFGTPRRVLEPVNENFRHLVATTDDPDTKATLHHLQDWSKTEFERLRDTFVGRRESGFVRECHGDMHLGNMILDDKQVVIFDCIEFNDDLRWIDVLSEVAFCVMDLEDRGVPEFGHRLLNRYLERTGDYAGLVVFRFYSAYRALVRAKVAALRCHQAGITPVEQDSLRAESASYLELGSKYAVPSPPALVITHGFSGSGKTTGTQEVVDAFGAVRIRSDVERKRLYGACDSSNDTSGLYSQDATTTTYNELARLADLLIQAGYTTVIDATFLSKSHRMQFCEIADKHDVEFRILDFQASNATMADRIEQRKQAQTDASDADVQVLRNQIESHEPLDSDELNWTIPVRTDVADWQQNLRKALQKELSA